MNYEDINEQWEYVTALPADENGLYLRLFTTCGMVKYSLENIELGTI